MTERRRANPLVGGDDERKRVETAVLVQAMQDELQAAMDDAGLDEESLARKLGVGPEAVEQLLDSTDASPDDLVAAAAALGFRFKVRREKF